MGTVFKRKIYDEMLVWKSESAGESALLTRPNSTTIGLTTKGAG